MKTRSFSPMGALHPILFFAGVYVVVLLFSIFICSALFYSCNSASSSFGEEKSIQKEAPATVSSNTAVAAR